MATIKLYLTDKKRLLILSLSLVLLLPISVFADAPTLEEYSQNVTSGSSPYGITSGPDGNLWFTEQLQGGKIGKITPSGIVTEYPTATSGSEPTSITSGPDGNLWFTEQNTNHIGMISTNGTTSTSDEYAVTSGSSPYGITSGPDGNLWFTEFQGNRIGYISTSGHVHEFSQLTTSGSQPTSITSGPDGNLWFTEQAGNQIGRITTSGTVTEFPIPTANSQPVGITSGPDGNLWFTEQAGNQIGRITTSGAITQYPTSPVSLMANAEPSDIVEGPDGNLWFTETNVSQIGALIFPVTSSSSGSNSGTPSGASLTGKVPKSPDTGFAMYRGNQTGIVLILTSMLFMAILLFYRFRHNKKTADIYR